MPTLSLIDIARKRGKPVVASYSSTNLQFAPHEDYATYPRTFERDCELLAAGGCDVVFAPAIGSLSRSSRLTRFIRRRELAGILEGEVRRSSLPVCARWC